MSTLVDLTPTNLKGKTAKNGKLPYEVLIFHNNADFEADLDEKQIKKHIVAKFGCYGDAMLYAVTLRDSQMYHKILLRA